MEEYSTVTAEIWRKLCISKYSDVCYSAYKKSQRDVKWYHIFRSLTLWPDLLNTQVTVKEFLLPMDDENIIYRDFQILSNGIIGILRKYDVVYYYLDTFEQLEQNITSDYEYMGYRENDNNILIHENYHLIMIRKKTRAAVTKKIKDVKIFSIFENVIHYATFDDYVYECMFINGIYTCAGIICCETAVLALGYENGQLYVMMADKNHRGYKIYTWFPNVLKTVLIDGSSVDEFEALGRYFANYIDWTNAYSPLNFFDRYSHKFPYVKDIQLIHTHGPVLFAGYMPGVLCIFYSVYTSSIIDLLSSEPLKVYCLLEPHKGVTSCNILNIDVVEGINDHTVYVAMRHKVIAIKFSYRINDEQWLYYIRKSPVYQILNSSSSSPQSISGPSTSNDEFSNIYTALTTTNRERFKRSWESTSSSGESATIDDE